MATIINESTARLAKQMRSFDDYKEGSATASYNAQCAEAAAILEKVKAKCATDEQRMNSGSVPNTCITGIVPFWLKPSTGTTRSAPGARPC